MGIKIVTSYHCTPVGMVKPQNADLAKRCRGRGATGTLPRCRGGGGCSPARPLQKNSLAVSGKTQQTLPYDAAVVLLGARSNKRKTHPHKNLLPDVCSGCRMNSKIVWRLQLEMNDRFIHATRQKIRSVLKIKKS